MTVSNIRLWDPEVLLPSYSQLQELRPYYSFTSVSVDRYLVNNVYTQTMLAPRELGLRSTGRGSDLGQPAHHLHARVRRDRVGREPGGLRAGPRTFSFRTSRCVSRRPPAITQPRIYYG